MDYYFPGESAPFLLQWERINSTILSKFLSYQIERWLSEDGVSGYLELVYWGSRDGWKASYFHAKCDDKGATITVIRSSDGFIFGGFADKPWISSDEYCKSDKAFLLSLKSTSNEVGMAKIRIKQNMCSNTMFHSSSYGPILGGVYEICIYSDSNNNIRSESIIGNTYEIPPGQTDTFLVGSNNFKVSEIEVFQII